MWPESSSVNAVNLAKKFFYNSGDIEFFLGDYFFGAPCSNNTLLIVLWALSFFCERYFPVKGQTKSRTPWHPGQDPEKRTALGNPGRMVTLG